MYQLMCKDIIRAEFDIVDNRVVNFKNNLTLPECCNSRGIEYFLDKRNAAKHRDQMNNYLTSIGCISLEKFIEVTHCLCLNDCYWVRRKGEDLGWSDVSLYSSDFDEYVHKLSFDGSYDGDKHIPGLSPEFGTSGNYDKCWVREGDGIYLIKRGSGSVETSGLEPYNEVLASQVFSKMKAGIPYKLVNYRGNVASKCKLFTDEHISFRPYADYRTVSDLNTFLKKYDSVDNDQTFRRILICDALTLNVDRHLNNHGFLCRSNTEEIVHTAPGFDYNLSFLPYLPNDALDKIDEYASMMSPIIGEDFIDVARKVLTDDIRKDLVDLQSLELKSSIIDDTMTEKRLKCLNDLLQLRIELILHPNKIEMEFNSMDGLTNLMKYKLKYKIPDHYWEEEKRRLYATLEVKTEEELEEAIVDLL